MTLAVAQFSLFRNCMTGPPCSFAVIIRTIYSICSQHSKLISLSVSQTDLTNFGLVAHLHLGLNSWRSVSINLECQVFPIVSCKKAMSQTSHLPLIIQIFMQCIIHILFYFLIKHDQFNVRGRWEDFRFLGRIAENWLSVD